MEVRQGLPRDRPDPLETGVRLGPPLDRPGPSEKVVHRGLRQVLLLDPDLAPHPETAVRRVPESQGPDPHPETAARRVPENQAPDPVLPAGECFPRASGVHPRVTADAASSAA